MHTCEFCLVNTFKSAAGVGRHQSTSEYCSQQLRRREEQRLARLQPATYESDSESDPDLGEHDGFDIIRGSAPLPDDYFDAPQPPSPVERPATPPLPPAESSGADSATPEEPDPADSDTFYRDYPGAARVIGTCTPPLAALFDVLHSESNPYAPFASKEEWELSRWAKINPITDSALNELFAIQGIRGGMASSLKNAGELNKLIDSLPRQAQFTHSTWTIDGYPDEYDLFSCNPVDVLRELVADPTFVDDIQFGAQQCYQGEAEAAGQQQQAEPQRLYNEMYASDFMWELQRKLPLSASPILIIIGSDKTQLTSFSGEHSAYPVYMSIGNISKHVRREPSKRAFRLVGYLPTLKPDETTMSDAKARLLRHRLFHKAMEVIFEPLFAAAENGIAIADSKGDVRLCFPVLASYVADYPDGRSPALQALCRHTSRYGSLHTHTGRYNDFWFLQKSRGVPGLILFRHCVTSATGISSSCPPRKSALFAVTSKPGAYETTEFVCAKPGAFEAAGFICDLTPPAHRGVLRIA